MAEYYVTQNYAGLRAGQVLEIAETDLDEKLRRGVAGGLLEKLKPVKPAAKPVEVAEPVEVVEESDDSKDLNKSA